MGVGSDVDAFIFPTRERVKSIYQDVFRPLKDRYDILSASCLILLLRLYIQSG